MTGAADMLDSTPAMFDFDRDALAECIAACFECAQACTACADACLSEPSVADLVRCIRLDLDCADICEMTGRVLSRQTAYDAAVTRAVLEPARRPARAAGTSAPSTACSTARCARRPVGAASRPATPCCPPRADRPVAA